MPIDFTSGNQLSGVTGMTLGLDVPQAYPYLADGSVFSIEKFEDAADYQGYSMLDWEPERETLPFEVDGTIGIVDGVVTKTGGTFANYDANVILGRIYVGEEIYDVASRQSDTQMTLVDTSVNVSSGTAYKWAQWDHRELDPKYAFNDAEWQRAHDEFAYALGIVRTDARVNGAMIGTYDLLSCVWRRSNDIIDDEDAGLYEEWQENVEAVCSYRTAEGYTLVEYIKEMGGLLIWDSEIPLAVWDNGATNRNRWLLRNERIMDTLDALDVPHAPLLMRHTVPGLDEFLSTGTGTEVTEGFQRSIIAAVHARQPFKYCWWGVAGQYTGYTLPGVVLGEQIAAASSFKPSWSRNSNQMRVGA